MQVSEDARLLQSPADTVALMVQGAGVYVEQAGEGAIERLMRTEGVTEDEALQLLELQWRAPYVRLGTETIDPEAVLAIPEAFAREHGVIAIARRDNELTVAMADPMDVMLADEIARMTGRRVLRVLAKASEISRALDRHWSVEGSLESAVVRVDQRVAEIEAGHQHSSDAIEDLAGDAPVVAFVNALLERAILQKASDIHIEPGAPHGLVRCRVDGVLNDLLTVSMRVYPAALSRLKIVSGMDISERRKPQDGRFSTRVEGRMVDLRVSVMPTVLGEKMVLRILDKDSFCPRLSDLGLSEREHELVEWAVTRPHGMFIVTGPTGSGKTTSLYAVLQRLNDTARNIVTCEDPVEYALDRINQVQLNIKAGMTFGAFLRSVLRQDPDVIMVGEMRDAETIELGIRAALTGHMVLTTLHTNDAPGAVARMLDMGAEPYLVASALIGVVAQRLVRRVCLHCAEQYIASDAELRGPFPELVGQGEFVARRGRGCRHCRGTGYSGRAAVFELFIPGEGSRALITSRAGASELTAQAMADGMTPLRQAALRRVLAGETTLEEAARISAETLAVKGA